MLRAAAHDTYICTWQGFVYIATVINCYFKGCGLVDRRSHAHQAHGDRIDQRGRHDGDRTAGDFPLRPRKRLHLDRIPEAGQEPGDAVLDGQNGRVLGQRDGRIVLLRAEETRPPHRLRHEDTRASRDYYSQSKPPDEAPSVSAGPVRRYAPSKEMGEAAARNVPMPGCTSSAKSGLSFSCPLATASSKL